MNVNNLRQILIGVGIIISIFIVLIIILIKTFPSMTPKFESFGESPVIHQRIINLDKSKK